MMKEFRNKMKHRMFFLSIVRNGHDVCKNQYAGSNAPAFYVTLKYGL